MGFQLCLPGMEPAVSSGAQTGARIRRFAFHEAGHVVAAYRFRIPIVGVTLVPHECHNQENDAETCVCFYTLDEVRRMSEREARKWARRRALYEMAGLNGIVEHGLAQ